MMGPTSGASRATTAGTNHSGSTTRRSSEAGVNSAAERDPVSVLEVLERLDERMRVMRRGLLRGSHHAESLYVVGLIRTEIKSEIAAVEAGATSTQKVGVGE